MDLGLKERSEKKAEEAFKRYFTQDCSWFLTIAKILKKLKSQDINITDILIREDSPILVGRVKDFYFFDQFEDIQVDKESMREFIRILLEKSERGMDFVDLSLGKKKSVDVSMSMFGYGIFRLNYSQDTNGDTLNIRVLNFDLPDFDHMDYPQMYHEFFKKKLIGSKTKINNQEVAKKIVSGGLIIHAGETGSGKTTSIISELKLIADKTNGLIITYEDPVEYRFIPSIYPRVRQLEIYKHILPEEIFRHFLRNSPSVGMLGELRTKEDYLNVLDLAGRGHLVITTLHARNVIETIYGFLNVVGVENRNLFLSILKAIVCHKLYMNEQGDIIPFYEILIMDDLIRAFLLKDADINVSRFYNFFYKEYKEDLIKKGLFYTFDRCLMERIQQKERLSETEKVYLKTWLEQ